jgi:hypothetical protein
MAWGLVVTVLPMPGSATPGLKRKRLIVVHGTSNDTKLEKFKKRLQFVLFRQTLRWFERLIDCRAQQMVTVAMICSGHHDCCRGEM